MSRIVQIVPQGKAILALYSDGTISRFKDWKELPLAKPRTIKKLDHIEKMQSEPFVLAKPGVLGNSYFTGEQWTPNVQKALQYSPYEIMLHTSVIPGTMAVPLSEALEAMQLVIGPRKRKKKASHKIS